MEVKINKEIRSYSESFVLGLSARQFFFTLAACAASLFMYLMTHENLGNTAAGWAAMLGAAPFALLGFLKVQDMPVEQFVRYFLYTQFFGGIPDSPKNLYAQMLSESAYREVLHADK